MERFLPLEQVRHCTCCCKRDGGDIISHLLKINEYAHVPVEIHMKIMTDAKTWLAMCNTMAHIFDFKSDQSADGEAMFHAERMKLKCTFLDSADA
uniref:Skp1_POZ domain-containing protein n=1 Tax=Bursaphelenchus xylophilus TaxID=6326 RepID=A0A1I7SV14_BURXY